MRRWFQSPFVYFAVVLIAAELTVRMVYHPAAGLSEHNLRNATPLRGWPEYTARPTSSPAVILIGNSQAIGQEFGDVTTLYSHHVSNGLAQQGMEFRNWSVSGLRTDQTEFLLLRALRQQPRLIVVVAAPSNLSHFNHYQFTGDLTDLHLTVGDPATWGTVWNHFFARDLKYHDLLLRSWQLNTRIGRSRDYLYDQLAAITPNYYHRHVFGHKRSKLALLSVDQRPTDSAPLAVRPIQNKMNAERWATQFREQRLPTLKVFYRHLLHRIDQTDGASDGTQLLWVWMPFALRDDTDTLLAGMQIFYQEACALIIADGHACIDLSGALPADHFLSPDISSHLNRRGHKRFGEILLPLIQDAIH